mmetsp:Transcript_46858/g.99508  ORF Transcript_46858/g.99508 Transcript_46858/m.99508 type:complete len:243 (-) Transcript_46858:36-764(-)
MPRDLLVRDPRLSPLGLPPVNDVEYAAGVLRPDRHPTVVRVAHRGPRPVRLVLPHPAQRHVQLGHGAVRLVGAHVHPLRPRAELDGLVVGLPRPAVGPVVPRRVVRLHRHLVEVALPRRVLDGSPAAQDVSRVLLVVVALPSPLGILGVRDVEPRARTVRAQARPVVGTVRDGDPRRLPLALFAVLVSREGLVVRAQGADGLVGTDVEPLQPRAEPHGVEVRRALPPVLATEEGRLILRRLR